MSDGKGEWLFEVIFIDVVFSLFYSDNMSLIFRSELKIDNYSHFSHDFTRLS